jgi:hypothetical protein
MIASGHWTLAPQARAEAAATTPSTPNFSLDSFSLFFSPVSV